MEETDPKELINQHLARTKRNRSLSQTSSVYVCDEDPDEDEDAELSQPPLPQQFFQELDDTLLGLTRDDYIREILRLCLNDYNRIDAYRNRLAERARALPGCPRTRLVNRRNSTHAPKEKKYAIDCYTLNAFLCGEKSKDLCDVFTPDGNNETQVPEPRAARDAIEPPDVFAMLANINQHRTVQNIGATSERFHSHCLYAHRHYSDSHQLQAAEWHHEKCTGKTARNNAHPRHH